jgi:hypothetical protein
VDRVFLLDAIAEGQSLLIEAADGEPWVVGVIATRAPERLRLHGKQVEIEASEELVLRAGAAGMRFRSDGDIELAGSRISALSRGLFRLVGRMLRLN